MNFDVSCLLEWGWTVSLAGGWLLSVAVCSLKTWEKDAIAGVCE